MHSCPSLNKTRRRRPLLRRYLLLNIDFISTRTPRCCSAKQNVNKVLHAISNPISDFMSLFYRLADRHIIVDKTAPFSYKAFRFTCEASNFWLRSSCTLLCLKSSQNYMGKEVEIMLQHQTLSLPNRFLELNVPLLGWYKVLDHPDCDYGIP